MTWRRWFPIFVGSLFMLSGLGGIAVGGTAAQAGWWLVVVGLILVIGGWLSER